MALQRVDYPDRPRLTAAARLGLDWLVSMQNRDGGWGAFDHNNDRSVLTHIPFADHNAMIDPSSADVTARVLECLGRNGWPATHPAVKRGVSYLAKEQTPEGSWYGRWGVNYVYGTSGVLRALETIALSARDYCQRAVAWLRAVQNEDGGFGESIASYYDPKLQGQGSSTPSQTAWGLIGLLAAAESDDPAVRRAVTHLIDQQNADGSWDEKQFTGTGFPGVFYLKYHLYRNYFPLYALSRYRNSLEGAKEFQAFEIRPEIDNSRGAKRGNG
jgi:squalene-hopene/tetraprenyl-beta-curcumene cyclase